MKTPFRPAVELLMRPANKPLTRVTYTIRTDVMALVVDPARTQINLVVLWMEHKIATIEKDACL